MNFLLILVVIISVIFLVELFKHQVTKNMFKYFIVFIVIIVILLITSAYIDFGQYLGKDSTFAQTGAVIVDGVSETTKDIDTTSTLDKISEKSDELFQKIIDN